MNRSEIKALFLTSPKVGCSSLWIKCVYLHIFVKGKILKCVCMCVPCFDASLQDVDASEIKVQVCVYAFDLLYLNGEVSPAGDEVWKHWQPHYCPWSEAKIILVAL